MSSSEIMSSARWAAGVAVFFSMVTGGCGSGSPRFMTKEPPATLGESAAGYQLQGTASYYAEDFDGKRTANGEVYDMHAMTAAHRTLPFGTKVRVTNEVTGKSVIVRINDRGPFKDNRVIDLSYGAAIQLGLIPDGTAKVVLEVIEMGHPSQ
jgi:rare lipoprotein A